MTVVSRMPDDAHPVAPESGEVHVWSLTHAPGAGRAGDVASQIRAILDRYPGSGGRGEIEREPSGKPRYLRDGAPAALEISISHASTLSLLAVARGRCVGVDVELVRAGPWEALPRHALAEPEQSALARLDGPARTRALLTYWVRKEAVLKCAGVGLAVDPRLLEVSEPWRSAHVAAVPSRLGVASAWALADVAVPGCVAAVALGAVPRLGWLP